MLAENTLEIGHSPHDVNGEHTIYRYIEDEEQKPAHTKVDDSVEWAGILVQ